MTEEPPLEERILAALSDERYQPLKPKALARKLGVSADDYDEFKRRLKQLAKKGRIELGKRHSIRAATLHHELVGIFRRIRSGDGFVRPRPGQGQDQGDVYVKAKNALDAATGDLVLASVLKRPRGGGRAAEGRILEVIERASDRFVGVYFTQGGEAFVRVDGGLFQESIYVGDPGVKNARDGDKVVFEMLRFPSPEMTGEGVVVEVLGKAGEPGVDLLSVIRQFHLPDAFSEPALAEAREQARIHDIDAVPHGRTDLTHETILTIDPKDARDFDDAIQVSRDPKGFWRLGVHIADVSTFVRQGSELDAEARQRGTSVYLPGRVLPMLPELISNGLASLQEGRLRLVQSVWIEFDPEGRVTHTDFAHSAIRVTKRLTYERVQSFFDDPEKNGEGLDGEVRGLLERARELARILRARRRERGMLELTMPDAELEYDEHGRIIGAHYAVSDESHQLIEEFMVTANEAVATRLASMQIGFLRRVHELPDPIKLKAFAEFVRTLGFEVEDYRSRFELGRVLREAADQPTRHAVHYALLRSLKEAVYAPDEEGHFALASDCYCHFTSPIRRYPDLVVHRLLDQWLKTGTAGADHAELVVLGEHCSFTERRAAKAERELIKVKLLDFLADKVGQVWDMIITGVEDFGFFAQGVEMPAEGLVHVRSLGDDFYELDRATHSLVGKRAGKRFRLGDRVRCTIWHVDRENRSLELRLEEHRPGPRTTRPIPRGKNAGEDGSRSKRGTAKRLPTARKARKRRK